jgi:hypothetical protein
MMPARLIQNTCGLLMLGLLLPVSAAAAVIYADRSLLEDCTTYDVSARSCSGGSATAFNTLSEAVNAAQPGDTVFVRSGAYQERLVPPRSGTASQPISIRALNAESVTITGLSQPAIFLQNRSYLIIEGLIVTNVAGFARLEDSTYNTFRSNRFSVATASGTTAGFKLVRARYNRFLDNTFEDGSDNMTVQESDYNLIQGNTFTKARHSLLSIRCGSFNVIRGNRFSNPDQKAAEIYDCEGTSDAPVLLDATKHNLFEKNAFVLTMAADADHRYNGIQFAGQLGLVRQNAFYDNQGGGLKLQVYSQEALFNYGNRIFNNTFFHNRCHGLSDSNDDDPPRYYGNRVENNLFYQNVNCSGGAVQMLISNPGAVTAVNNALRTSSPGFVSEAQRDLRLAAGSPMIDSGVFLTTAVGAGSGTMLTVADAGYFFDGYGLSGEIGDLVQFEGQTATARVVGIDYAARRLTLDRSLTWRDQQRLHLAYAGSRPDVGAFEYSGSTTLPAAPTNLRIVPGGSIPDSR